MQTHGNASDDPGLDDLEPVRTSSARRLALSECEAPELEVEEVDFGTGSASTPRFDVEIADQPLGYSLRAIFAARGVPVPADYGLFKRFDLWLVPHRVHVRRLRGSHAIVCVGLHVQYQAENETCSVVSLFPEAQHRKLGSLSAQARVSFDGSMSPLTSALLSATKIGASLDVGVAAGASAAIGLEASILSPLISVGGKGSSRCHFTFELADTPLFGRDIETWSVLVLPKRKRGLTFDMWVETTERLAFVPTTRSTPKSTVRCRLLDDVPR